MVWDRGSRTVAVVDDVPAIGLSAETAKLFADMLDSQDSVTVEIAGLRDTSGLMGLGHRSLRNTRSLVRGRFGGHRG